MSALTIRRLVVWAVSMVMGFAVGWLIITFVLPALSPEPNAQAVSIAKYGNIYFLVTVVPLGLIFMTILDHFMDTRIWPD